MNFRITLRCEAGHEQTLTTEGMTEEMAREYGAILDGTSSMFVHPPLPESRMHKCGYPDCGKPFRAAVEAVA